jgi:hypothetical protein
MIKLRRGSLEWRCFLQLGYTLVSWEGSYDWLMYFKSC